HSGPILHVGVNNAAVLRRAVASVSLAFGEAYVHGDVEVAEDELDAFFWILARNRSMLRGLGPLGRIYRPERNRRDAQRGQISRHYDVGNDYYRLFLDPSLTYSCGYFETGDDPLELAQRQKLDHTLRKLRIEPGQRLLDIGSGWGQLAVTAAKTYDVSVVGVTLSREQASAAAKLAAREGVGDRVRFELMNYQDLPESRDPALHGPFDRIVSVGMFEHVGRDLHRNFFEIVDRLLTPGGVGVLTNITDQMLQNNDAWVDRYIFPGGYLPTVAEIEGLLAHQGLWSIDRENLWHQYARTLSCWRANHRANREQIIEMFDEEFYRMRDLWLAGSKAGFDYGTLGLAQFVFTKDKPSDWPLTRRGLYAEGTRARC
ncbi:MAG: class I SAM-dependent methyltransferase, partial [Nocardioidaceae bacterium]